MGPPAARASTQRLIATRVCSSVERCDVSKRPSISSSSPRRCSVQYGVAVEDDLAIGHRFWKADWVVNVTHRADNLYQRDTTSETAPPPNHDSRSLRCKSR